MTVNYQCDECSTNTNLFEAMLIHARRTKHEFTRVVKQC